MPLAFHVDYWDYLGWRDPWASKAFSQRQQAYAQTWRTDSVYTPGFVLNGHEWRSWLREKNGPPASSTRPGVLLANSADRAHWHVTFSPAGPNSGDYEVHAAILANDLISDVKAGENRGRRLSHDFVVTSLTTHSLMNHENKPHAEFVFRAERQQSGHLAIAFWVTHRESLEPLQAVGGWLSD